MKNLPLIACLIAGVMMSCSKQESKSPEGTIGFLKAKSENIDLTIKSMKMIGEGDSAAYRATYSEDAVFYDNTDTLTLDQNISIFSNMKAKGATMKLDEIVDIKEMIYPVKDKDTLHYVSAYAWFTLTRGDKSTKVIIHSVDKIENGKQVKEFLRYDTKNITEILK
jgi:hypothetical protein